MRALLDTSPRIAPIPTTYRDIEFRSKLEANVAQVFDALGVPWTYEQEGYQIGEIWYLPDFFLPEARQFVEVKGALDHPSMAKPLALAGALGRASPLRVVVLGHRFVSWHLGSACELVGVGLSSAEQGRPVRLVHCEGCGTRYFRRDVPWATCAGCSSDSAQQVVLFRTQHRLGQTTYSLLRG